MYVVLTHYTTLRARSLHYSTHSLITLLYALATIPLSFFDGSSPLVGWLFARLFSCFMDIAIPLSPAIHYIKKGEGVRRGG
jgi:hypothetical protein